MKKYLEHHPWKIIEKGFHKQQHQVSESIFSIGNGRMGQRANFEEAFTGESLQGSYVAGVYYPDKTRVGWWKNGYPEYFAKVLNAPSWIGIAVVANGVALDLNVWEVANFERVLDMQRSVLERRFEAKHRGIHLTVETCRFCSIVDDEAAVISYKIKSLGKAVDLEIKLDIDADIVNSDSNYDEKFWAEVQQAQGENLAFITAKTKKLDFEVCTGMQFSIYKDKKELALSPTLVSRDKYVSNTVNLTAAAGEEIEVQKFAVVLSSENHAKENLLENAGALLEKTTDKGYARMLKEQAKAWAKKWEDCDIEIQGDVSAQQGIRFNIFQLHQTYSGEDPRLNIGPKGFTGEKYGGSTYWDTEAYCLPFYLSTADQSVARNLLIYRHNHLQKAIENAEKLGFKNGAALYPMVTMNGEECHNEWEITFEEIHRNAAIAYAIFDYVRYTGDRQYIVDYGLEVLLAIARFWAQRVNYSQAKEQYVMLGVTGPNEYENNVNNNWYTNTMACWCLKFALECWYDVKEKHPEKWASLQAKIKFEEETETARWMDIMENMFVPYYAEEGLFEQQEGFMDKQLLPVTALPESERPIHQHWSWDRILRSCFIKQADVLQGLYFLEHQFDLDTIRVNFDFYEQMTVHESSLSPCVHSILASKLGYKEKAYDLYLQTARLDLDDYNNDTEDGCHITSMGGTWMSVVKGFGGMRVKAGRLSFDPWLPDNWEALRFKIGFRGRVLLVSVTKDGANFERLSGKEMVVLLGGEEVRV